MEDCKIGTSLPTDDFFFVISEIICYAQHQHVTSASRTLACRTVVCACVLHELATLSVRRRGVTWNCIAICSSALDTSDWLSKHTLASPFPDAPMALPSTSAPNTGTNQNEAGFGWPHKSLLDAHPFCPSWFLQVEMTFPQFQVTCQHFLFSHFFITTVSGEVLWVSG